MRVCMLFLKIYVTLSVERQKNEEQERKQYEKDSIPDGLSSHPGEFYGCNRDVFVDDFPVTPIPELALDVNDVALFNLQLPVGIG